MLHKGEGHDNLNLASLHSFAPALPRLNTEMRYQERYYHVDHFESDTNGNGSILRSTKMTLAAARQKNLENMSYKHNQPFYYAIIEMGGINKF